MPRQRAAQLRKHAGHAARAIAGAAGFELVRRSDYQVVPRRDYVVVPRRDYDVVRRDYYSPIPNLSLLPDEVWTRRSPLRALELSTEAAIEFVEHELGSTIAELDVPLQDPGIPGHFFLANDTFQTVDAELLYAMVRAMRPARVIELGSGYTTLLINLAAERNAAEGIETAHEVFDPHPRPHILGDDLSAATTLKAISATEVPQEVFSELESGDILFVDTTHTVKVGSDVNFVILDVLPALAPGVLVHFHDIFLPWEYPRAWMAEMGWYWAEQYLLQAFLAFNREFEILVPAHALAQEHPDRLAMVIPSFWPGAAPGSMWLRRLGSTD